VDLRRLRFRLSQLSTLLRSLMRFSSSSISRPGKAAPKPPAALEASVAKGNCPAWPVAPCPHMVLNISRL